MSNGSVLNVKQKIVNRATPGCTVVRFASAKPAAVNIWTGAGERWPLTDSTREVIMRRSM